MRATIELRDDLLAAVKRRATFAGVSLKAFFIEAIELKLAGERKKTRRTPPAIGSAKAPRIGVLTAEQIDEALFG